MRATTDGQSRSCAARVLSVDVRSTDERVGSVGDLLQTAHGRVCNGGSFVRKVLTGGNHDSRGSYASVRVCLRTMPVQVVDRDSPAAHGLPSVSFAMVEQTTQARPEAQQAVRHVKMMSQQIATDRGSRRVSRRRARRSLPAAVSGASPWYKDAYYHRNRSAGGLFSRVRRGVNRCGTRV
jgi:hypothetical protein